MLPLLLATSLRFNDRCPHGIVIKLNMSFSSPFSVVTKQNDPAAAAYLCLWRHCPMLIIGQNVDIWVEQCPLCALCSSLYSLSSSKELYGAASP